MHKVDVLIIEDNEEIRALLRELLEGEGLVVRTAAHGAEGLERLQAANETPRLILLDLMMPVMDGWEFLKSIRTAESPLDQVPVVLISAIGPEAVETTAYPVLPKPFDIDRLLTFTARYCCDELRQPREGPAATGSVK